MTSKITYKIQELTYGGMDAETENKIKACAKKIHPPLDNREKSKKFHPIIGAEVKREYLGKLYEVLVVKDGFAYNNEVYNLLSTIATKIAGPRWNELKFFGAKK